MIQEYTFILFLGSFLISCVLFGNMALKNLNKVTQTEYGLKNVKMNCFDQIQIKLLEIVHKYNYVYVRVSNSQHLSALLCLYFLAIQEYTFILYLGSFLISCLLFENTSMTYLNKFRYTGDGSLDIKMNCFKHIFECTDYFCQRDIDGDYQCNGHDCYTNIRYPYLLNFTRVSLILNFYFCAHVSNSRLLSDLLCLYSPAILEYTIILYLESCPLFENTSMTCLIS